MADQLHPDEADFHQQLDQNPADWDLRSVYADWLEENGRLPESEAQRWMVSNGRHPIRTNSQDWFWHTPDSHYFLPTLGDTPHYRATPFFINPYQVAQKSWDRPVSNRLVTSYTGAPSGVNQSYPSRHEAEVGLGQALQRMKQSGSGLS